MRHNHVPYRQRRSQRQVRRRVIDAIRRNLKDLVSDAKALLRLARRKGGSGPPDPVLVANAKQVRAEHRYLSRCRSQLRKSLA